jgi:RNA polymerase sigma factor (TIGR02999 family)
LSDEATRLLEQAAAGDERALERLLPLVYDELRRLAARYLQRERRAQSMQATALVHEAYLRLLGDRRLAWQSRAHFFGIAARSMRQILVERARARLASKRGGSRARITLDDRVAAAADQSVDVLALHEALERLAAVDAELARLVELRFFGGLTIEEAAEALSISPATLKRNWATARAWLRREMGDAARP